MARPDPPCVRLHFQGLLLKWPRLHLYFPLQLFGSATQGEKPTGEDEALLGAATGVQGRESTKIIQKALFLPQAQN